jgi:hypothetical protein
MATFNIILDKRTTKGQEKHQLALRVSHQKTVVNLWLGIKMNTREYDSVFNKKSFDSVTQKTLEMYEKYIDRAKKIFLLVVPFDSKKFRELYYDKKYNPDFVTNKNEMILDSLELMVNEYIRAKLETGEISESTASLYNYGKRSLLDFKPNLKIIDITSEFLYSYEKWFMNKKKPNGKKNSLASVGNVCRTLKSVFNYFKKKKVIPIEFEYPFLDYKIPNYTPPKRVISLTEIQSIIDCNEFDDLWEEYARDIWVFLYRMNGSNFIDMLKLEWSNKVGDYFIYIRHKTKKTRRNNIRPDRVRITEKIQSSLEKIGDKSSKFVLGQMNVEEYNEKYLNNRSKNLKRKINKYLKIVGKKLNLSMSLDISLGRDAYANTLKRANINPLKISENMNHSDPRTTTLHYLDQFEQDDLDDANDVVL